MHVANLLLYTTITYQAKSIRKNERKKTKNYFQKKEAFVTQFKVYNAYKKINLKLHQQKRKKREKKGSISSSKTTTKKKQKENKFILS
jgi:hypothetical protein